MELLHKLGVDWMGLLAQVINFFIIVLILRKFVYKPVLELLHKRSKMIEKSVNDAKEIEEKLEKVEVETSKKLTEAEKKATGILEEAKKEAEKQKESMKADTNQEIEKMIEKGKQNLLAEKDKILGDIKSEAASFILLASQKVIGREFSDDDQKRLQNVIQDELRTID